MSIETAIKKAIEGGWKDSRLALPTVRPERMTFEDAAPAAMLIELYKKQRNAAVLIDASFWQCLGKAVGWFDADPREHWIKHMDRVAVDLHIEEGSWLFYWYGLSSITSPREGVLKNILKTYDVLLIRPRMERTSNVVLVSISLGALLYPLL